MLPPWFKDPSYLLSKNIHVVNISLIQQWFFKSRAKSKILLLLLEIKAYEVTEDSEVVLSSLQLLCYSVITDLIFFKMKPY